MRRVRLLFAVAVLLASTPALARDVRVQGRVIDQSGLALPGVSVTLTPAGTTGEPVASATTAADGAFSLDVAAGDYRLNTRLDGFEPLSRVVAASASLTVPDLVMALAPFSAETTVVAALPTATELQPRQFGAPATIAEQVFDNAPLRSSRYDDMLPLLPNVIRGPDGLISVAGARAPSGAVLLNGLPSSDIATGDPIAVVPIGAIETVRVVTTGFAAEFGPSTGGVTIINSRSGADVYRFSVNSFTPRPRLVDGGVKGIEAWDPNTHVRGPIVKGRAWFAQSLDYHYEKTRADTAAGSQDRKQHGFTSFTQADAKTDRGHAITAWFNGQKDRVDGEHLGAFTPRGTVPLLDRSLWSGAAIGRTAFAGSTLEARVDVRRQQVTLTPDGTGPYLVAHDLTRGAYFDATDRRATSVDAAVVYSRAESSGRGHQLFKAGATAGQRWIDGREQARPVTYLRQDGSTARVVEFEGSGRLDATSAHVGAFAQDTWEVNARLTADLGARVDAGQGTGAFAAPRAGVTWAVDARTTVTGGFGWFTGEVPLAALAFDGYQARRITTFDASGAPTASPVIYPQVASEALMRPFARVWSARLERGLKRDWQLRLAVQERRGEREVVVTPARLDGAPVALLSTAGRSRIRSLETTLGYRASGSHQFYVSYVRAAGRGNTNDFGEIEGLFRQPRLDTAESAPLPASVPHRVLAWGLFSLPGRVTIAPFLDLRSGFAYSAIRDDWSYVESRNGRRYPVFASLDLVVNKIVTLPHGLRARVGVKLYNVAGRRNGRDVQACIDSGNAGQTYNGLGRQVRGVFEIIWAGSRR
jgi:hypothetical protein